MLLKSISSSSPMLLALNLIFWFHLHYHHQKIDVITTVFSALSTSENDLDLYLFSFWNSISGLALDSREVEGDDNNVEDESEESMLRQEMIFKNSAHLVKVVLCSSLFTREQASRDPENYFNIRMLLRWLMVHKSCISLEQVVENTTLIDPIYVHSCLDIGEHLTTIHLSCRCLYQGSTSPGGFPNSWNGASYCTSDLAVLKNSEIHLWDRGFDENRNQKMKVWYYRFGDQRKARTSSSINENLSSLNILYQSSIDRPIQGSLILQD
ncbi:hypothetical protein HID58_051633 [Brassica napus]|uniref:Uncharacterized protein n=1 Tax=Brassica napus TaxID=3708 RepID=A0ABQ8A9I3_BRANA|nr:hypothetical protein HID58_051633 [Brassica napus]